jgi:hypothetical protein
MTATVLSGRRHPRATDGLPTYSRLSDDVALRAVGRDCGLWADPDGRIVTSTAGPVIAQRADGQWVTGTDATRWLAHRLADEQRAAPELQIDDLATARSLGVIYRAQGVRALALAMAT